MNLEFSKGREPRPGAQSKALEQLADLDAKYILLSAPVGCGKSEIGMAAARGAGSAFVVSPQNILLDQYIHNFQIPMVKGKKRYQCQWANTDCGTASETYEGEHTRKCQDYIPARNAFWEGPISVTNLHYACFANVPGGYNGIRDLLVVDECHGLEPMLLDLFHIHVHRVDADAMGLWFDKPDLQQMFLDYIASSERSDLEDAVTDAVQRQKIKSTARRLKYTKLHDAVNPWHVERDRETVRCRPLFARNIAPQILGRGERVLFMSGTPGDPDRFFRNLGIDPKEAKVVEVDSDFPVGEGVRLVKGAPIVTKKSLPRKIHVLADAASQILRALPDEKGLILCASYDLGQQMYERLRPEFGQRLLAHNSGNREAVVREHRAAKYASVLIGVNMHEGLDLADDLARFLIIPKVLFPAFDSWARERDALDPGYYKRQTAARMVQACGRVVRGPEDWSHIFILDRCMLDLLQRYPEEFPAYFRRSFRVE